ncbi:MAG: stage II sporulation protein M [Chloroflexota bacterium]
MEQLSLVWLIARRELRDQFRDWRIIFPMIVLTIFFPFLMNFTAREVLDFVSRYGASLIGERLVPFLLMVVGFFPITVSLVIALEAFVGEKERGTIEPLLSSPLKDWQLYLGKLIAATSVPLLTAYLGISVYLIGLRVQHIPFPDLGLLVQTITLTSVQAVLMVSGAIVISTQATSVRAANLMSSFVIIPMALLIQGESVLMFWGNNQVLWLAVAGVTVMAVLLVRVGLSHFQREVLLGREIDILNLRWMGATFWQAFRGEAKSLGGWYRREVTKTLRRLALPILILALLGLIGMIVGYTWILENSSQFSLAASPASIKKAMEMTLDTPANLQINFHYIWLHNLRAMVVILLLGLFSFGVLGTIVFIGNIGLIGAVLALVKVLGYSPTLLALSGILPHAIFETPALILSSAAVLHIGLVLVTPIPGRTLGEVLLEALADWAKIGLGLVLPLLTVAAAIEVWVTPRLMLWALK